MWFRKLLALPLLPAEHITPTFDRLSNKNSNELLSRLFDYVAHTWIGSSICPPHKWSVYKETVRTNNDVEGWHRRLNCLSRRGQQPFYMLVDNLHSEAKFVSVQTKLVEEHKLHRYQRSTYAGIQCQLHDLWEAYEQRQISISKLLRECGKVCGPSITTDV